jgi:phage virion morphogenesis protein
MRVEIDLDDADFQAFIQRISAAASDMSPAMKAIASLGEQRIEDSFQSETAPDGTAWEDSRRKKERGGKTLTKEGNLRRSASSDFDGQTAMWGVGMEYGAIHQFGGTITAKSGGKLKFPTPDGGYAQVSSVTIPARPFLPNSIEQIDQDAIIDILGGHLLP